MPYTRRQAVDTMFGQFNVAWNNVTYGSKSIVGYVPQIIWQGKTEPLKIDFSKYFVRVSQQTVLETQSTLTTECFLPGHKRFTVDGMLFVQLFCPKSQADAEEKGGDLARIARDAYRTPALGQSIFYRRGRIQELAPEEKCIRFNVVTEYQYDEIS